MRNNLLQRRARILRHHSTDAEHLLWRHLRRRQLESFRFRRQVPVGSFIADFACLEAKLIIEVDGGQHAEHHSYDAHRDEELTKLGYRVLRFWDNEVLLETDAVLEEIMKALPPP